MYEKTPELIWWNGEIVPWQEATVHVTSEVAMRGANVFEGVRAYWQPSNGHHAMLYWDRHLDRLRQSARLLRFPAADAESHIARMYDGAASFVRALNQQEDLYLRPTLYIDEGRYGWKQGQVRLGSYIAAYPTGPSPSETVACIVSSWRRTPDPSISPLIKVGAAYLAFRLPRIEAQQAGADEAILLNTNDTVAETGGAAVFLVRDGVAVTPPLADGVLDSITRRTVIHLLRSSLDIPVIERSIPRTELYTADEAFLCGTLDEVRSISSIDDLPIGSGQRLVGQAVRNLYLAMCSGTEEPLDAQMLTPVKPAVPSGTS
ncbi:aminotransferase class IV [Streptomyces sp. NPDC102384]|uniref:aminotransferase class IV n=1 Tax=Streptomyces sp. NPDC102384 TaxID=3366166 RepID=UPI0037F2578C